MAQTASCNLLHVEPPKQDCRHQGLHDHSLHSHGEATRPAHALAIVQVLKSSLGPLPFLKEGATEAENGDALQIENVPLPPIVPTTHRPAVLPDGSYATQVALPESLAAPILSSASSANLRCCPDHLLRGPAELRCGPEF